MKNLYEVESNKNKMGIFAANEREAKMEYMRYEDTTLFSELTATFICEVNYILNVDAFVRAENEESEALVKEAIKKIENKSFKK